jgi:DNA-binding MurR/RpiR family transcriptional regulator
METPPQNLEELKQKFALIMLGQGSIKLGTRSTNILKQMLDDPGATSVKTITELADEFGVHRSTLTRLAQKLQFDGFPCLQAVFRQELKGKKSFYSEQVNKFLQKGQTSAISNDPIIQGIIKNEWSNLLVMLENYDESQFNSIIDLLSSVKRVNILGLRGCYPISYFLGYYLRMIRNDVYIIGMEGHILVEEVASLLPEDLLVAISVMPYTKATIDACKIAEEIGVDIVVITDSQYSPLVKYAKHKMFISIKGDFYFSPITAGIIYVEALLSAVVRKFGEKAIRKLKQQEYFFSKMGVEIDNNDSNL